MSEGLAAKIWLKLQDSPALYFRLLWNAVLRRRQVVVIDYQGSLGDMVSFCASLPGLRERHAPCWIIFVASRAYLDLVRSTKLIDAAATPYGFLHLLAKRLCPPENYYIPTALSSGGVPETRNFNPPIHTAIHFAQLLGVEPQIDAVRLDTDEKMRRLMKERLAVVNPEGLPVVVVHTGPTWKVKEWPDASWDKWSELVRENLRVCVIQIGTEASTSPLHNHAMARLPGAVDWVNRLGVMESVSLIEQAQLFVGIDSGPLHLATTLGTPTIGLFGPVTGAYRAHPRAPFTCLTANVPCLGCHHDPGGELHWRTGCPYDIRCMHGISADDVFHATRDCLATNDPATANEQFSRIPAEKSAQSC